MSEKIKISSENGVCEISFCGEINYKDAKTLYAALDRIRKFSAAIRLNFSLLNRIDYASLILIIRAANGKKYEILGANDKIASMLALINEGNINADYLPVQNRLNFLARLGKKIFDGFINLRDLSGFLGEFLIKTAKILPAPSRLRGKEISNYVRDAGVNAVFIVALTSFLIGIVLAYLGSSMLASFGASIFIVEIMGMLTLREVGPLIAAIVIAGRSASSFTAQIGAMKISEEIDAMKTMGFDPFNFLVLPRIIAMTACVPIVIFLADAVSITGQMFVCKILLGIDFSDYLSRFRDTVELRHFAVGMIKAPFFGAIIAIIGCMRGLGTANNAQSLGEMTTLSVVNAIFWVITIDAFFAIAFSWMKI